MKNKKGISLVSLFIVNFFVSIIAVTLSVGVYSISNDYQNAVNGIAFQGYPIGIFYMTRDNILDRNEKYKEFMNERYKEVILSNKGWIEIVKNGEVKEIIGNKKDKIMKYKVDENGPDVSSVDRSYEENYKFEDTIDEYKSNEDYINNVNLGYQISSIPHDYERDTYYVVKVPYKNIINEEAEIKINTARIKTYTLSIIPSAIVFTSIIGCCLYFSIKSIKKPLKEIEKGIEEIRRNNLENSINFHSYKEMNEIKDAFNYMSEEIRITNIKKNEIEESKKKMIRDISHDIKTPLTSIMGYSKAIIDKQSMSDEEKEVYLNYIYKKTLRINSLTNELLKYINLDSENYKLDKIKQDYCEFIREVISIYYKDMEDKNFNLEINIIEDKILLAFDSKNLERALGNLIINAIKYNNENTTLKIIVKKENNKVVTIIQDDGIGIDKNLCSNIFDEFVRGDESRNTSGGSGLGLAITKKIVSLHGGEINLVSDINKGCKFTITL